MNKQETVLAILDALDIYYEYQMEDRDEKLPLAKAVAVLEQRESPMIAALAEVDRIYSTPRPQSETMYPEISPYGLVANHDDCGKMIGSVREVLRNRSWDARK